MPRSEAGRRAAARERAEAPPPPRSRTIAYCRVSTDQQVEEGQSLDVQRRQLEGWAMQRGSPLDQVVVEAGISGAVPFHERPEGGKLWQLVQRGDAVVASRLDRMFRSASDCLAVVEAFKAVSLFLLDLNGGADDVSGDGIARLFLTIVSAFAEFERSRIGERIRATKQQQKARGEFLGGRAPFGFVYDAERQLFKPVPEQQRTLRLIRSLHRKGLSAYRIAAELKARGTITVSHVTIRKLLNGRAEA